MKSRTPMRPLRCHGHGRGTNASEAIRRHALHSEVGDSRGRPKSVPMSAADGVVRTDSLGPAPHKHETRFPVRAASHAVSPELALVDADLARELRAELPEPAAPPPSPVVEPIRAQAVVVPALRQEPDPTRRERQGGRRSRKLRVVGFVALGALLTVFVRNEPRPSALDRTAHAAADPKAQAPEQPVPVGTAAAATAAGQTFVWTAEPDAAAYEFQLFRGSERIYRARVTAPRLVLPGRWRLGSRSYGLTAASYRWYVWPISTRTRQSGRRRDSPGNARGREAEPMRQRRTPRDLPRSRDRGPDRLRSINGQRGTSHTPPLQPRRAAAFRLAAVRELARGRNATALLAPSLSSPPPSSQVGTPQPERSAPRRRVSRGWRRRQPPPPGQTAARRPSRAGSASRRPQRRA